MMTPAIPLGLPPPYRSLCSFCSRAGRVRCSVCKEWYCTAQCQANHWPVHRRECFQPPVLVWPDGSKYDGELEEVAREKNMTSMRLMVQEETVSGIDAKPAPILPTKQKCPSPLPTKQPAVTASSASEIKEDADTKQSSKPAASPVISKPSAPTKPPAFKASSETAKQKAVSPSVSSSTKQSSPAASPVTAVTPFLSVPSAPAPVGLEGQGRMIRQEGRQQVDREKIMYNVEHVFRKNGREVRKMPIEFYGETIWVECVSVKLSPLSVLPTAPLPTVLVDEAVTPHPAQLLLSHQLTRCSRKLSKPYKKSHRLVDTVRNAQESGRNWKLKSRN